MITASDSNFPGGIFDSFWLFYSRSLLDTVDHYRRHLPLAQAGLLKQHLTPTMAMIAANDVTIPGGNFSTLWLFLAFFLPTSNRAPLITSAITFPPSSSVNHGQQQPLYCLHKHFMEMAPAAPSGLFDCLHVRLPATSSCHSALFVPMIVSAYPLTCVVSTESSPTRWILIQRIHKVYK